MNDDTKTFDQLVEEVHELCRRTPGLSGSTPEDERGNEALKKGRVDLEAFLQEVPKELAKEMAARKLAEEKLEFSEKRCRELTENNSELRLDILSKALREITDAVIEYREFSDIAKTLLAILRKSLPIDTIEFYSHTQGASLVSFTSETGYKGVVLTEGVPTICAFFLDMKKDVWYNESGDGYKKLLLSPAESSESGEKKQSLLIPLFYCSSNRVNALVVIRLSHDVEITKDAKQVIEQLSYALSMALERETIHRLIDVERGSFYQLSIKDPLTDLYNRFYMEDALARMMYAHDRQESETIVAVIFDVDNMKEINDSYGRSCGDEVIVKVAEALKKSVRRGDIAVRYGGEEFAVFLIGNTVKGAMAMAKNVRKEIISMKFSGPLKKLKLTVSAGLTKRAQKEPLDEFLERAEKALAKASGMGLDRACVIEGSLLK